MNNLFIFLFCISLLCIPFFIIWALINLIRKKPVKKRLKQSGISFLIMIASLFGVGFTTETIPVESITVSIPNYQEEYDINETIPVEISVFPENASTTSFKYMADSDILSFSESEIITGSKEGTCEIYIESDGIKSNSIPISVVDITSRKAIKEAEEKAAKETEEKRLAEEKAAKEAEVKQLAQEAKRLQQEEEQRLAEKQAVKDTEEKQLAEQNPVKETKEQQLAEEAEHLQPEKGQQQATQLDNQKKLEGKNTQQQSGDGQEVVQVPQNQDSDNSSNFNTYDNPDQQQTSATYVLNTNTKKFHYPSCKSVKKIAPQNYATSNSTRDELIAQNYQPCGICSP